MRLLTSYKNLPVYGFRVGDKIRFRSEKEQIKILMHHDSSSDDVLTVTKVVANSFVPDLNIYGDYIYADNSLGKEVCEGMYSARFIPVIGSTREVIE